MSFLPEDDEPANIAALAVFKQHLGLLPRVFRAQMSRPDLVDSQAKLIETLLFEKGSLKRIPKGVHPVSCLRRQPEHLFSGRAFADFAVFGHKTRSMPSGYARSSSGKPLRPGRRPA